MKKRWISWILVFVMVVAMVPAVTASPAQPQENQTKEDVTYPAYPDETRPYWIIFKEGYRSGRVELSVFDITNPTDDLHIVWDRNLKLNDHSKFNQCNQYYIGDNNKWVKFVTGYGVMSDYATEIIASNLDVYNRSGELICAKTDWPGERYPSFVQSGTCGDNLTWVLDNEGTLKISGTGNMHTYSINNAPWYDVRDDIKVIKIESGVTSIGYRAFVECSNLVDITIPEGVTHIDVEAFYDCTALTDLIIPGSVITIGKKAFMLCSSLASVKIGKGVENLGNHVFNSCVNLTSVELPDSIHTIPDGVFSNCTSLRDVYYSGTESQWDSIRIGWWNSDLVNATIHFESEMPDTPVTGYQMHAYGSCRDGAISRGEEMTVVIELCKDGVPLSDWDTPAYTIGDRSIISITKNEKKGDYVYLTVRGVRVGKSSLTVTDSRSGAYVAMEIEVRDSDAVPSCFFITNVPRFYPDYLCERNNLTNFYNFNGLYVCDFPYPDDIKKVDGKYNLTFTVYNSTHMYGSVDIFDSQGNWKGCERINKHTEITGLWDTAKSAFFLIRDLVATDILSYNAASFSTPTKVTVTVPEGGYITISNNFVESQGTYIYNTVDFLMLGVSLTMDLALGKYELEGVQEQAVNQILQTPDSYKTFMSYYPEIGANIIADLDEKGYGAIVESITLQSFDLFEEMNFDFLGTVDTVLDSAGNVAEDIFVKCTPVALGATLKGMFAVNGALDRLYQAMDISRSENKPYIVLYTPEAAGGLTMSGVTVTPDEGSVTEEAVLQVFRIGNTDAMVISDEGLVVSQYELYNICFTVNDKEIQPNGMVTVKIPIPESFSDDKCIVFHQRDDGQWSKVDCWIENGFIVFEVDHFSQFALIDMSTAEPYVCPFTDVPDDSFYYESVMWAVENGITNGATASTFDPGGTCLRAHVVTFLHRADGNPEPGSSNNPFSDVKNTDFFYKPVLWAVENGITNGTTATTFGSYANCNRAAVVTFLWRAAGSPEPESTSNPFVDVKPTDYFYKPVLWAAENSITSGIDATHFGPTADCNRAQVVTFLYRAYN